MLYVCIVYTALVYTQHTQYSNTAYAHDGDHFDVCLMINAHVHGM